jgi:Transposase DDE domain
VAVPGGLAVAGCAAAVRALADRVRPSPQRGDLQKEPPAGVAGVEPADHGLGRSRGGWTTKPHLGCELGRKPLALLITAGQRGDSPQFATVLERIRVPRLDAGRPRTRPDRVLGDNAYSSKGARAYLRRRRIRGIIPVKEDQAANRRKLGSHGGRPPTFDKQAYKLRHALECGINLLEQHRGVATGSTSWPCVTRPPSRSPRSTSGSAAWNGAYEIGASDRANEVGPVWIRLPAAGRLRSRVGWWTCLWLGVGMPAPSGQIPPPWARWENKAPATRAARRPVPGDQTGEEPRSAGPEPHLA